MRTLRILTVVGAALCLSLAANASVYAQTSDVVRCTGKVVDPNGRPVPGARVKVQRVRVSLEPVVYELELIQEFATPQAGTFVVETRHDANDLEGQGLIVVEKEGLAVGWANWQLRGDIEVEIRLDRAKSLAGQVVDEAGRPVADAEVSITMMVAGGRGRDDRYLVGDVKQGVFATKADAEGRFSLERLPPDATLDLLVKKTGRATVTTFAPRSDGGGSLHFSPGQLDVRLVQPVQARLEGTVVDKASGRAVAGISVAIFRNRNHPSFGHRPAVSGEDGGFRFGSLSPGTYLVQPVPPRGAMAEWIGAPVEVSVQAGQTQTGVKVELQKGGVLEMVVTDAETKKPVDNASASIQPASGQGGSSVQSGKDGIARLRLLPGQYQASAYKSGYESAGRQEMVTIEEGKAVRIEYSLAAQPRIKGVVLDPKGNPVKGASVMICPLGGQRTLSGEGGAFEVPWSPRSWGASTPAMVVLSRYEAGGLACVKEITEEMRSVDIHLVPGVTFTGKVVDPNGKAIAGAAIDVSLRAASWGMGIGTGDGPKTDEQGVFEIKAIPVDQRYTVQAGADGYGTKSEQVQADSEGDRLDIGTLQLQVANLSASGIVMDINDKPVDNARVSVYGPDQPHRSTQTDAGGRFTVDKFCAGQIQISANGLGEPQLYGRAIAQAGDRDIKVTIVERSGSGRPTQSQISSLKGKPLPDLKDLGVGVADANDKALLVCFLDIEQRPSRKCLSDLAKQSQTLSTKQVAPVVIQTSKADLKQYEDWLKTNQVTLSVQTIEGDFDAKKSQWGVKALPWLILTDKEHVVVAEGFAVSELDTILGR